jgi:hypothetical protein
MPDIPIVMFTLYKTDELEAAAKLVGIRCVIGKEDGVRTLLRAIETQLQPQNQVGDAGQLETTEPA